MAIHTKQMTNQLIKWLEDEEYEVVDTSYGNDLCDSIEIDNKIHVTLPNSFIDDHDKEYYTTFHARKIEDIFAEEIFSSINEVLEYLNELK